VNQTISPTLDTLFQRCLSRKPEAIALIDPNNKPRITGSPPRGLTYAQADRAISALAAHFIEAGLPPHSVLAVQLPNTIEFALTVLAAHRAGLVVALFPLLWRQAELVAALNRTSARAIVTSARIDGVIHADLFPDNVFFLGDKLSGLIDFYFACTDTLVYDVAICLNAWCFETDHSFNVTKARALLANYAKTRPLSHEEWEKLPLFARGAALRFLLTRLVDWLDVPPGALVRPKDPREYARKLRFHQKVKSARDYGLIEP